MFSVFLDAFYVRINSEKRNNMYKNINCNNDFILFHCFRLVQKMMCCLTRHFAEGSCDVMVVNMTLQAIQDVHSVVRSHCPVEEAYKFTTKHCPMPRKRYCRMSEAIKCLPVVTTTNRGDICSYVFKIKTENTR